MVTSSTDELAEPLSEGPDSVSLGDEMHGLARRLFPICRSITGAGVRETIAIIAESLPGLKVHEVPSGTPCFDWEVPNEWTIRDAYVKDPSGRKIIDFQQNNLHVVGYSEPVRIRLPLKELDQYLYSLPGTPEAVPYVTSYYERRWGFCLPHRQRELLEEGEYEVCIDSDLEPGHLTYAELLIPGESEDEVLLSSYVCHPSMANNELSGPVVLTFLARWIASLPKRRLSYRIVLGPETIGALLYLSRNLDWLKAHVVAGYVVTCVGDERAHSYVASRAADTLADRIAQHALHHLDPNYRAYSYLDRGSDERQYCAPGIDLPVAVLSRSRFWDFPEYHTSLDDLSLVTPNGLFGGFTLLRRCVESLEANSVPRATVLGEPQLGRRGLYRTTSTTTRDLSVRKTFDLLAYADGERDLTAIADLIDVPVWDLAVVAEKLAEEGLLRIETSMDRAIPLQQ